MSKPACSKLLKLKKWLTVPEAAKHLTDICGEEVGEADIFRFALDGYLILSVNLVNHAYVKPGIVVYFDEEKLAELESQSNPTDELKWTERRGSELVSRTLHIGEGKYLKIKEKVEEIDGIWDLLMFGGGIIYVEQKYHELTSGSQIKIFDIDGILISRNDEIICEVQENYDDDECLSTISKRISDDIRKTLDEIQKLEQNKSNHLRNKRILVSKKKRLAELREEQARWYKLGRYYPAAKFPEGSVLVVRTDALIEFMESINESEVERGKKTKSQGNAEDEKDHGNTEVFAKKREPVLGAALYVMTQCPDQCCSSSGKFEGAKIAAVIDEKALLFWPKTGEPPLKRGQMERLINKWLHFNSKDGV